MLAAGFTFASCALFGNRPDRDEHGYYHLLLNNLAEVCDVPLVVATNEPAAFHPRIETVRVEDLHEWSSRIWDPLDQDEVVIRLLQWHRKNRKLAQFAEPHLIGVYLAKMALLFDIASRHGDVVWIDAGLVFSAVYHHSVPGDWRGYDRHVIETRLMPRIAEQRATNKPMVTTFRRRRKLFHTHKPHFQGMSYDGMESLARRIGAVPDDDYTAAAMLYLPGDLASQTQSQFKDVWAEMVRMGRMGTEETVLTELRWKNGWDSLSHVEWLDLVREAPNTETPVEGH